MNTSSQQATQHSPPPVSLIDPIEKEAQATELFSKLESADNDSVTLSTSTLHYFAQQISNHLNHIMEHIETLDVSDQSSVCNDP